MTAPTIPADVAGLPQPDAWAALREQGWTDRDIGRAYGISRQRIGQVLGPRQRTEGRRPVPVPLTPDAHERLRQLAAEHGYRVLYGPRVGDGSLSDLLEAIAAGRMKLQPVQRSRGYRHIRR